MACDIFATQMLKGSGFRVSLGLVGLTRSTGEKVQGLVPERVRFG
jgi:hypothetical protein